MREERASGRLLQQSGQRLHASRSHQRRAEQLAGVLFTEGFAEASVDLVSAEPKRELRGHEPADARATHVVDGIAGLLEGLQEPDVRISLGAAGAERDA